MREENMPEMFALTLACTTIAHPSIIRYLLFMHSNEIFCHFSSLLVNFVWYHFTSAVTTLFVEMVEIQHSGCAVYNLQLLATSGRFLFSGAVGRAAPYR